MKKKFSRRILIKGGLLVAGGSVAAGLTKLFGGPVGKVLSNAASSTFLPSVLNREPTDEPSPDPELTPSAPGQNMVVHVHDASAHNWTSGSDYWSHVNQGVVDSMVDRGLMQLTSTTTIAAAWHALLPNYDSGEIVAIKVSFNNSNDLNGSEKIDAVAEPINRLIEGLIGRGVLAKDIWIYELATRIIPTRFRNKLKAAVTLKDNTNNRVDDWPDQTINFNPPGVILNKPSLKINPVLTQASYLINVPIMKRHGMGDQVSLGFKNHYGSVQKPMPLHIYSNPKESGSRYSSSYSPHIEIFQYIKAVAQTETILTVGDALFAAKDHVGTPSGWTLFGGQTPKSLFFSKDPVAIDCVMADWCVAEMGTGIAASHGDYLKLAAQAGLGVHERRHPVNEKYTTITYRRI